MNYFRKHLSQHQLKFFLALCLHVCWLPAEDIPAVAPSPQRTSPSNVGVNGGCRVIPITKNMWGTLPDIIRSLRPEEAPLLVIDKDCPRGEFGIAVPSFVRVLDYRYDGGIHLVRGNHPRLNGHWPQYGGLKTGLRENITITDVITPTAPITDSDGKDQPYRPLDYANPTEYHSNHNHYQNLLSEVWNFNSSINGVAIWGDSGAFVPEAKAWGAFFSARSTPMYWDKYLPDGWKPFEEKDFDAALVGIEIDVLNGGKPWGGDTKFAKTGVQIVGFGAKNTQAIEIRCEDSEAPQGSARKGQFQNGIVIYNSISDDGTVVQTYLEQAKTGIDFSRPTFNDGALKISANAKENGIIFNNGKGGYISSEKINGADGSVLTIRAGTGGFRVLDVHGVQLFPLGEQPIGGKSRLNLIKEWLPLVLSGFALLLAILALLRKRTSSGK